MKRITSETRAWIARPAALVLLMHLPHPVAAQTRVPASGTAWDPAAATHPAIHVHRGAWGLGLHGNATLYRADEGGVRGEEQWGSTNWIMGSAERPLGGGLLRLRGMISLEPATIGDCGIPNLLQTGEICDGQAIVDAQHPHDFFSELSASFGHSLGREVAADLYLAPVGEPALGSVAYPHRESARFDPISPITHHWIDATHVVFGVATLGVEGPWWRTEASLFNAREPDEERYDFDYAPLESVSARIQLVPTDRLAIQVSRGRLRNSHRHVVLLPPELECPPAPTGSRLAPAHEGCHIIDQGDIWLDVDRTTASVSYHHPGSEGREWSLTAAWGRNEEQGHADTDGALVEGRVDVYRGVAFGRAERVEKTDHDLGIRPTLEQFLDGEQLTFDLTKIILGYASDVVDAGGLTATLGAAVSWSRIPSSLEDRYGERWPVGAMVFAAVRPGSMGDPEAEQ
jgi:hypothetical protein